MTPELKPQDLKVGDVVAATELDKLRVIQAENNAASKTGSVCHMDVLAEYRHLVVSNWQPTPKPSPRVMAMRKWLKVDGYNSAQTDSGDYDSTACARAFLGGYAAAVELAKPVIKIVEALEDMIHGLAKVKICQALTTYLTAIGEETR